MAGLTHVEDHLRSLKQFLEFAEEKLQELEVTLRNDTEVRATFTKETEEKLIRYYTRARDAEKEADMLRDEVKLLRAGRI